MDKLKEKLLKLYRLSQQGDGGEKQNAETALLSMLKKHGLTIADIDESVEKDRFYKYNTLEHKQLILQIVGVVSGKREVYRIYQGGAKFICAELTDFQHVQILEMIDFHIENMKEEKKKFMDEFINAYIQKHNLGMKPEEGRELEPLTPEEAEKLMRILAFAETMENKTYHKKLNA